MIQSQPSATATAGASFAVQPVVYEEDRFGNLETGDNSTVVTASVTGGGGTLQGATSVTVSGGVARFMNLANSRAGKISLDFSSTGLATGVSSAIAVRSQGASVSPEPPAGVTAPVPAIRLEQVVRARKINDRGRRVGKPRLLGFAIDYSMAMDPSTVGLAANYQVDQVIKKRSHETHVTLLKPVNFSAVYSQANNSVLLTVKGRPKFINGGEIQVIASGPTASVARRVCRSTAAIRFSRSRRKRGVLFRSDNSLESRHVSEAISDVKGRARGASIAGVRPVGLGDSS